MYITLYVSITYTNNNYCLDTRHTRHNSLYAVFSFPALHLFAKDCRKRDTE